LNLLGTAKAEPNCPKVSPSVKPMAAKFSINSTNLLQKAQKKVSFYRTGIKILPVAKCLDAGRPA